MGPGTPLRTAPVPHSSPSPGTPSILHPMTAQVLQRQQPTQVPTLLTTLQAPSTPHGVLYHLHTHSTS